MKKRDAAVQLSALKARRAREERYRAEHRLDVAIRIDNAVQALLECPNIVGLPPEMIEMDEAALLQVREAVSVLLTEERRLDHWDETLKGETLEAARDVTAAVDVILRFRREREIRERERRRAGRLAARPHDPPPAETPRCARCEKKPRAVDDYCKKCAREMGILVRGKIGEG